MLVTEVPVKRGHGHEELVLEIRNLGLSFVAFTYNEPTLQAEYILEAAPLLRENGIAVTLEVCLSRRILRVGP